MVVFAVTTFALIVVDLMFVPVADRFRFGSWVELSIAALFLSIGTNRLQNQSRAAGTLYIAVAVFLVLVVLIGTFLLPAH